MSNVAESKVTGIVKALSSLENDLDSLNAKVADMKKSLNLKSQTEIDKLMISVREMATADAESIINKAKEKANAESAKISQNSEKKIGEIQAQIDANFDQAVKHIVSTVLKA
ncbi:MAG: hypothetical protein DWQ18_01500 [Crenarchaeota archaeon]|nr:MAG: hypothetical protein DWQ17_03715 [Thermoproteota archaeon]RDJ34635.1 MAG: hypothetical protein DWQ18_01500 [Thermoproteota archaeon]RDJ34698.1 MAG: hypothetical protein DWQ19_14075 [Thermoproteota archaeon]RDJ38421.1 MAG: hypothetical protein DWQ13_03320 [Thermoproteota archaeon]